jgi:Domain of unknown function (DUF4177)
MRQKHILILVAFLLVGMISWAAYSQRSNVMGPHWEYMLVSYVNSEETSRKLNELGAHGWELVAVSDRPFDQGNQASTDFVLKRAK